MTKPLLRCAEKIGRSMRQKVRAAGSDVYFAGNPVLLPPAIL